MKIKHFLVLTAILFFACKTTETKSDAWATFQKCSGNNCVKEALAVKDAFVKNPQQTLNEFQATYEKGEDHVIGWLYILRDSVLLNSKMGTMEERLAMQQTIITAAKPFEKDAKVQEMAKSVMDELGIADIKTGKVNDSMAGQMAETTPTFCYQLNEKGEHASCQFFTAANGEFTGYYTWFIEGKDGTQGVLKGKNFNSDTLYIDHSYIQEGIVAAEELIFLKKGDNLVQLVSETYDKSGKMVLKDRKKLKAGNTLTKVDCAKLSKEFEKIQAMEKDMMFKYPDPILSEKEWEVSKHFSNSEQLYETKSHSKANHLEVSQSLNQQVH